MRTQQLFSLGLVAFGLACASPGQRRRGNVPPPKLVHGSYTTHEFDSAAMGRKVPYGIYLPNGYAAEENKDKKYPLVIWLHGMWEDHMRFHERGGSQALDDMIGSGDVPELVLVCPSPGRNTFYINGKDGGRGEDLIEQDLLQHVDATYRVEADRGKRALMGVSMGGMAAMRIAFKHPELFGTVATHSAALFPADLDKLSDRFKKVMTSQWVAPMLKETFGDPVDPELWKASNPLALAEELPEERLRELAIYFDAGTKDRYEFHLTNELLHESLEARHVPHTWRKIDGGGHSWGDGLAASALHESLAFVAQQFARAGGQSALRGLLGGEDSKEGNSKGESKGESGDRGKQR
ncbi:MAG: alpha/beta hydrolase-fold protein [Planctomycetota bacterium]